MLKGGLLMKQYYQFMLHEVLDDLGKADCNIDAFEEDLHKMLMVRTGGRRARVCLGGSGGGGQCVRLLIDYICFSQPTFKKESSVVLR